ncbi:MAG: co-chaperone GroES [Planctomycetota bacterium]
MGVRPLDDRVVVEMLEADDVTAGGIVLPDTAKEKPQKGKVVAVGPGRALADGGRADPAVQVGDVILCDKFGGDEAEIDGKDCRILRETDILAIIE